LAKAFGRLNAARELLESLPSDILANEWLAAALVEARAEDDNDPTALSAIDPKVRVMAAECMEHLGFKTLLECFRNYSQWHALLSRRPNRSGLG
jgi:hypothetical protein